MVVHHRARNRAEAPYAAAASSIDRRHSRAAVGRSARRDRDVPLHQAKSVPYLPDPNTRPATGRCCHAKTNWTNFRGRSATANYESDAIPDQLARELGLTRCSGNDRSVSG
jgi:hypothetical protein